MRRLLQSTALALIAYNAYIIHRYMPFLPPRIPVHFTAGGQPNGWGSPGTLWFLLAIQAGVTVLMLVLPALTARIPGIAHVGRHRLTEFDPASRRQVIDLLSDMMTRVTLALGLLFVYIIRATIRAALVPGQKFAAWVVIAFIAVVLLIVLVYTPRIMRLKPQGSTGG